jgi:hypothetical protein
MGGVREDGTQCEDSCVGFQGVACLGPIEVYLSEQAGAITGTGGKETGLSADKVTL